MSKFVSLLAVVVATSLFVGCEEKKEGTEAGAGGSAGSSTPSMMDKAKEQAAGAKEAITEKATEVKAAVTEKTTEVKAAVTEKVAAAKDAAADLLKDPQAALTKIQEYIGANKFTEADGLLKQLEGLKDKLPDAIKEKLPSLRETVDKALKMGAGMLGK